MSESSPGLVDIDTGHEYDGIRELDNPLPNWWLFTLWASIVFGACYWLYFETTGVGVTQLEALALENTAASAELASAEAAELVTADGTPALSLADTLTALSHNEEALARGKTAYDQTCAACHRQDGGGMVGPNLTDNAFIHGGAPEQIYKTVADGILAKGMPAWKPVLGPARTKDVVAYVMNLPQFPAADGKAPQGPPINEAAATATAGTNNGAVNGTVNGAVDGTVNKASDLSAAGTDAAATDAADTDAVTKDNVQAP